MKNVVGRRKFAPNLSEEMWMLAFPVGSKVRINLPDGKRITVTFVWQKNA